MLTLTRSRRGVAGANIYPDDSDLLTWYFVPDRPSLALDSDGKPLFSMVMYRRDVGELSEEERRSRLGGGILSLTTELRLTDENEALLRQEIAKDADLHARLSKDRTYGRWWRDEIREDVDELAAALKLSALPVTDGTVTIAILAEEGSQPAESREFTANIVGAGKVSMVGAQRASFQAKLTLDGAVLLWNMLEQNLPGIRVAYELTFQHRLDAVAMIVHCDAYKTFHGAPRSVAVAQGQRELLRPQKW